MQAYLVVTAYLATEELHKVYINYQSNQLLKIDHDY